MVPCGKPLGNLLPDAPNAVFVLLEQHADQRRLQHLGRFKRLIVQDIQAFQGLQGTLPFPTGLEPVFPP
jgi:hypothetical protein